MNLKDICDKFRMEGRFFRAEKLTTGNVNNTYLITCTESERKIQYILQRINRFVFENPEKVMHNVTLVTEHLAKKYAETGEKTRKVLEFIRTDCGLPYFIDQSDNFWRCYRFVADSVTFNCPTDLTAIEEAGRAFGDFQNRLADFDAKKLYETIPDFHNAEYRFRAFCGAVCSDPFGRSAEAADEIEFLFARKRVVSKLNEMYRSGKLPLKVTHNDTKCNNVLFDKNTHRAVCVIDLDTVMPGIIASDYGDAVRSIASTADEDEQDLSKVDIDFEKLEAFTRGFVSEAGGGLSENEFESLPYGVLVLTIELATRFLKDYLDGDLYFRTAYEKHNLVRAKCQIRLASIIEANFDKISSVISSMRKKGK